MKINKLIGKCGGLTMADTSAVIGINLKEEERQEAGVSVGASGSGEREWARFAMHYYLPPRQGPTSTHYLSPRQGPSLVAHARKSWSPEGGRVLLEVSRSSRHAGYLSPRQGHHKGPPFRSTPPSPLRTVMSFSYVDVYQGR